MACCGGSSLLGELNDLVKQIGEAGCCAPCNTPCCAQACCNFPFAQVTMTVPPPILAPIRPEPVKPLGIWCPEPPPYEMSQEKKDVLRVDNFYNSYNIDWREKSSESESLTCETYPPKKSGVTVDGKDPCCKCHCRKKDCPLPGCPTGFKPCTMKLQPPPCCHPLLPWCAEIQPCPPSSKKKKKKCATC